MTSGAGARPLVVVDAANVVGSVPDGWWRDRHGATERLRDSLADLPAAGLAGAVAPPLEVVFVVEGRASRVTSSEAVRVVAAAGEGDDAVVDLVRDADGRPVHVVTADRGLRDRVARLGATVHGPRAVRPVRPTSTR